MTITAEQADQAKDIILQTLDTHYQGRLPYRQVWTKPAEDFEGVSFLDVWVIYDGLPDSLDIGMINSYGSYLYQTLLDVGIRAIPSISYIPQKGHHRIQRRVPTGTRHGRNRNPRWPPLSILRK